MRFFVCSILCGFLLLFGSNIVGNSQIGQQCDGTFEDCVIRNLLLADQIVVALDTSGSIKDANRLPKVKRFAKSMVNQVLRARRNPAVAVIQFNSNVDPVLPFTRLDGNNIDTIEAAIDSVQDTEFGTWMSGAIDEACTLRENEPGEGALVLASDGLPTVALDDPESSTPMKINDPELARRQTQDAAEKFKDGCSTLVVIAFGVENNSAASDFLESIASPGAFLSVPDDPPGKTIPTIAQAFEGDTRVFGEYLYSPNTLISVYLNDVFINDIQMNIDGSFQYEFSEPLLAGDRIRLQTVRQDWDEKVFLWCCTHMMVEATEM